jgi:hypothetical protein
MAENEQQQEVNWEERYKQLQATYQGDMERVYNVLTQQQQAGQQAPAPEEPLWDTSDAAKLKEQVEGSLRRTVAETIAPVMTTFAGNQFEANAGILRADPRFPYFAKWEQEIRQLASQVHPGLLAKMDTLTNIYALVASRHQTELVEEEVQKRIRAQEESKTDSDEVEVEDEEESGNEEEEKSPRPQVPPPAAVRTRPVSVQPSRSVRTQPRRKLTREEAYMAERLGMTPLEYAKAKDIGDIDI